MREFKYLIVSIYLLGFSFSGFAQVILSEDFSGGPTDYTTGSYAYDSGNTWELTAIQGENDARFQLNTNASIITPAVNTVGTISFQYKEGSSGGGNLQVLLSVDGSGFTELDAQAFAGNSFSDYSLVVNNLSDNCKIKVTANSGSQLIIDNFEITEYVEGAELLTNTPALSGFLYYEGEGPSTTKFFNLSGSLLTGYPDDITVSAPTNYEISLDDVSFLNSLAVPYNSANLSSTTIYVRLKSGLSLGDYNENITISGGGADNIFVSCSGSVTEMPPPAIYVVPEVLTEFSYIYGIGPSDYQSYQLYGNYLTDYPNSISVNAPANYEISLDNANYSSSLSVSYDSYTLPSTTIYVRLKSGLDVGSYNAENITNVSSNYGTKTVSCSGIVEDLPPDPTLYLSPTSLSGFSYIVGNGPSSEQSYTLSGANLTGYPGDITVTAPTNYEISLSSGTDFSNSLSVPFADANFTYEIYVRLKVDLTAGDYNDEAITHTGGGATEVILSCSGAVLPESSDPCLYEDFSGFTDGAHGSPGSVDLSPNMDSHTLTIGWEGYKVFSAGGEVKLGSSSYEGYVITPTIDLSAGGSVSFDYAKYGSDNAMVQIFHAADGVNFMQIGSDITPGVDFDTHTVEILDGTANSKIKIGTTTKRIYLDNVEVYCGIQTPDPVLYVNTNELTSFSYLFGEGPSLSQSFELSGNDLDNSQLEITPSLNYEISLSESSDYTSNPVVLNSFDGNSMSVYVRLKADLPVGDYNNQTIIISGSGAASLSVTCSGFVQDNVEIGHFTDESIQIYPNPVSHSLFVEFGQSFEHFTWTICDITGRVFNTGQESEFDKTIQIDVSNLQSGLYVLILTDGHHRITRKIEKL
ncbi:MAG: T9SS type A sorting domain-containing protein [Bacteroidota bacterium]|nr:T9SS type A sorting domain-containing protein [Bacteroidota bacterium]